MLYPYEVIIVCGAREAWRNEGVTRACDGRPIGHGVSNDEAANMRCVTLFHAQPRQRFFQERHIDLQITAHGPHVFHYIEGAEQAQLDRSILFGLPQSSAMGGVPGSSNFLREKNADRVSRLAIGSDVEDVLGSGAFGRRGVRR